ILDNACDDRRSGGSRRDRQRTQGPRPRQQADGLVAHPMRLLITETAPARDKSITQKAKSRSRRTFAAMQPRSRPDSLSILTHRDAQNVWSCSKFVPCDSDE